MAAEHLRFGDRQDEAVNDPGERENWFIGLPVPGGRWLSRLSAPPRGVRIFGEADLHVTIAFFGKVSEPQARAGFALAGRWPLPALEVSLGAVEPMGPPKRASALSALIVAGDERLREAIGAIRGPMLEAAGARPDARPPLAHVTLARIRRRAGQVERRAAIAWARALDLGEPHVILDRLALYRWSTDRCASLFRVVDSHPL